MENNFKYGIIAVLLVASVGAWGRNSDVKHFMGLSVEAAEWSLLPAESKLTSSLGIAGSAGFVYDMQAGHFLLDFGVGVTGGTTKFRVPDRSYTIADQTDKEGDTFDYICQVNNREDAYSNLAVKIPVLLGGQWKRFYALAGVKFGFNALTKADMGASLTAYGHYFQYMDGHKEYTFDRFFDEPPYTDEFFANRKIKSSADAQFNVNIDVSLEIGARLGFMTDHTGFDVPKSKVQYRLALFADYGVLDLHKPQSFNPVDIHAKVGSVENALQMNHILSTADVASSINNLLIGIKFTVLFELPQRPSCIICRDNYRKFTPL